MKNRASGVKHTAGLVLALICLTSGLALPNYCRTRHASDLITTQTATDSGWTFTGDLNTRRYAHTATLLPDGKVLVAGGAAGLVNYCPPTPTSSAELYDPVTGTWSYTGSLNTARVSHTATLLPNGQVLVAGGRVTLYDTDFLESAELYDPPTGRWRPTGSLNTIRALMTFVNRGAATLLPNGKVLAVGASDPRRFAIDSAELYDPATGTWSSTGASAPSVGGHVILLPNNKVLALLEGSPWDYSGIDTELYDPDTGQWSTAGYLNVINFAHTVTLLRNGKVLVTGESSGGPERAELYDATAGTWSITGNLNTNRYYPYAGYTATLQTDGRVLVTGGVDSFHRPASAEESYDPSTGTWSSVSHLIASRRFHTATLLVNGKTLIAGGVDEGTLDGCEVFIHSSAELFAAPCADPLSPASQSFDTSGGAGFVTFTAASECSWTAVSYANWISLTSDTSGGGNGTVSYLVAPNESTTPRVGLIGIAARFLSVNQEGVPVRINRAIASGKKLFVSGERFDPGAVILLNGEEQKTKNDGLNPQTNLIGKKAGKKIKPGDKLHVRNPNGTLSEEFIFTG